MPLYNVFVRTWWKSNPDWPQGLEPCPGRKRVIRRKVSREEARQICQEWNTLNKPGRFSRKAEFEEA